jgi:hypothetical protein
MADLPQPIFNTKSPEEKAAWEWQPNFLGRGAPGTGSDGPRRQSTGADNPLPPISVESQIGHAGE